VVVRTSQGFSNNNVKIVIQNQSTKASGGRKQLSHQSHPIHRQDRLSEHHGNSVLGRYWELSTETKKTANGT
jgi:hypothetical protein